MALLTATDASAQVCASLTLTTQAQVDAVRCSSVTGGFQIGDSTDITNLDGLSGTTSVGDLGVSGNAALTNLDGLEGIASVGEFLFVVENAVLNEFCGLFPLLDGSGLVGTYTVSGNASNPTEAEILAAGRCLVPVSPVPSLGPAGIAILVSVLGLAGHRRLLDSTRK